MPKFKVTLYVEIPFETYVEAETEQEAIEEATHKEPYIPYLDDDYKEDYNVVGDIIEFPNLGNTLYSKSDAEEIE